MAEMVSMYDTRALVREIQSNLRTLSLYEGIEPMVAPDGIYGDETASAVADFQLKNGLYPSGNTDLETFLSLSKKADEYRSFANSPGVLMALPGANYKTFLGEESDFVCVIQMILRSLCIEYVFPGEVRINGCYDEPTRDAVAVFQRINLLPQDGMVDRTTWERLCTEYNFTQSFANGNK